MLRGKYPCCSLLALLLVERTHNDSKERWSQTCCFPVMHSYFNQQMLLVSLQLSCHKLPDALSWWASGFICCCYQPMVWKEDQPEMSMHIMFFCSVQTFYLLFNCNFVWVMSAVVSLVLVANKKNELFLLFVSSQSRRINLYFIPYTSFSVSETVYCQQLKDCFTSTGSFVRDEQEKAQMPFQNCIMKLQLTQSIRVGWQIAVT